MTTNEHKTILTQIEPITSNKTFETTNFTIKTTNKNLELKLKIFHTTNKTLPTNTILTSNTSSISITKLTTTTNQPKQIINIHFINPIPLMKLYKLVHKIQTSQNTYNTIKTLTKKFNKTIITNNNHPNFIINHILIPLLNKTCFTLQKKITKTKDINTNTKLKLNHPMGPLELNNLINLDTILSITKILHHKINNSKYHPPTILHNLITTN